MRRLLGLLIVLLLLAAGTTSCGSDSGDAADDASGSPTPTAPPSDPPVDPVTVAILSRTAAGGEVSPRAVPLPDAAAVARFAEQFVDPAFGREIAARVRATDVPSGRRLMGAVVAIGCDVPDSVTVTVTADGVSIVADKAASPVPECFAAVTSVALVLV
jgi:hypothetical protein